LQVSEHCLDVPQGSGGKESVQSVDHLLDDAIRAAGAARNEDLRLGGRTFRPKRATLETAPAAAIVDVVLDRG
jgi:hypothetical protein